MFFLYESCSVTNKSSCILSNSLFFLYSMPIAHKLHTLHHYNRNPSHDCHELSQSWYEPLIYSKFWPFNQSPSSSHYDGKHHGIYWYDLSALTTSFCESITHIETNTLRNNPPWVLSHFKDCFVKLHLKSFLHSTENILLTTNRD